MTDYLKSNFITEEKINIHGIPTIIFRPKEVKKSIPTIILYHGWSSNKDLQRVRGLLLSSVGYQVVLPDAIHHGERNALSDYDMDAAIEYFWDSIFKNLEEFSIIEKELVSKYNADSERIAVMGNSMGGFTAGGIFTHNEQIKTLIVLSGSCAWEYFNTHIEYMPPEKIKIFEGNVEEKVKDLEPISHLNLLKDRPILLLHGESDTVVPIEGQRVFYNKLYPMYKDKEKIKLIEYPRLNHFVTTNMMEECINWFGKYL